MNFNCWTTRFVTLAIFAVLPNQSVAQISRSIKSCAVLYEAKNYDGLNFGVEDGKYFSNLEHEQTSSSTVWNLTSSFKVSPGCLFTACNESYFDGHCQEFREETADLPPAFLNIESVNCTCPAECRCSSISMRKASCARAYLHKDCNSCNSYYTDLKGSKPFFPEEFKKHTASVIVRPGCTLTVYDEEEYAGESSTFEGIVESWKSDQRIASYECTCSNQTNVAVVVKQRSPDYPEWINIPKTLDEVIEMANGEAGWHPGLRASMLSLKHNRSSRNAYILVTGTTGAGKSSFINLLFDNPNLTKMGGVNSTTADIYEFRVPVPVDELGIANSELRVIDTPGLRDTRGIVQDAKFLATFEEYLTCHEDLSHRIPNVVLVFHKFTDNRFAGEGSNFVKMLRGLDAFRPRITDVEYSNVIFVLSHFNFEAKDIVRRPKVKLASFKRIIEDYSLFPKPVSIVVAENKAANQDLPLVNGYYRLPNGDYYPRNVFEKIQVLTESGGDPIGGAIITAAFRDLHEFNITLSTTSLVDKQNTKIPKYVDILNRAITSVENTEVSQLLGNASESLSPELKKKFPEALRYLQRALHLRNIQTVGDIPRTTLDINLLLTSLKQNEAILYLLEHGLSIRPPTLSEHLITGYSYDVFGDKPLPITPFRLGVMKNSDIGYNFPAILTCLVERKQAEIFQIFENKDEYVNYRLESLNIGGRIPANIFTNRIQSGSNIKGVTMGINGTTVTAVREFRTFELVLNEKLELSNHFVVTLKSLKPFNATDHETVEMWKNFFNKYGTHVVQSAHGGGAIEITLTSDKPFGTDTAEALYDLLQFADDVTTGWTSNRTLERDGIQYHINFRGGNRAYHVSDFTMMSLDDAASLLKHWKASLSSSPIILTSETRLLPLSDLAREIGQNISLEIQRSTEFIFNSSLKYEYSYKPKNPISGSGRDESAFPMENRSFSWFADIMSRKMEECRKSNNRFQKMLLDMEKDRKEIDARRDKALQEQLDRIIQQEQLRAKEAQEQKNITREMEMELQRERWQHELLMAMAREKTEFENKKREEEYRLKKAEAVTKAKAVQERSKILLAEDYTRKPGDGGAGCLLKGTLILMADGTQKSVENVLIGDMVLDHELKPTMVVAVLEKFLLKDTFYGFNNEGPYFFTNTHVLVGPSEDLKGIQLLTHSLDGLREENPLFEFLKPKRMNRSGTKFLTFNEKQKRVTVAEMTVYEDPNESPEDTMVHIIEVDSIHGTYFANGVVCRHELPPIEHWPNTMYLLLSFGMHGEIQKFEDVPYTLATVFKTRNMLSDIAAEVTKLLKDFMRTGLAQDKVDLKYEMLSFDRYEVMAGAFINPSFATFGAGLYEATGKKLALVLDNPSVSIQQHHREYLYNEVTTIVIKHVNIRLN